MLISIPDNPITQDIIDFTNAQGYSTQISDGKGGWLPNPQTQTQFFEQLVLQNINNYLSSTITAYRVSQVQITPIVATASISAATQQVVV